MGDSQTQPDALPPPITGADLYGKSGRPHGSDITQGELGDCYLISTLGQFADRQPGVIRDAIHYEAKDQSFAVRLHDAAGQSRIINVTQDDLRQDRAYGPERAGGVDSPSYWASTHIDGSAPPAWPSVMEVAYAKLNAASPKDPTAADLANIGNGGWPKNAIHALTGRSDTREVAASDLQDASRTYEMLDKSIKEGRPVLLATYPMKDIPNDGLVKGEYYGEGDKLNSGHAYTVEGVAKDRDGNVSLTLRNPWGTNKASAQGVDSLDPIVHVSLKTILDNGHLQSVTIGPGMEQKQGVVDGRHQQDAAKQNTAPGARAGITDSQPTHAQTAAADPARALWSNLAAKGADIRKSAQGAAQAEGAGPARTASNDPARAYWSDLAAKGAEIRKSAQGAAQAEGAGPAHTASNDPARAYWSDLAAKGAEIRRNAQGATPSNDPGLSRGRGRAL